MEMKIKLNIRLALLLVVLIGAGTNVFAGKRYWVGTGANVNWNSTANWSASSGGGSGAAVPGSSDSVYYDGNGTGQCSINATVSVRRFETGVGYTDTVKQNAFAITVGTSGMILNGGTFQGGTLNIIDQGIFTLAGCVFISTNAILTITGNYTFSSGTFIHNNGDVWYRGTSTIDGNTTFNKLGFAPSANSTYTINLSTTLTVMNELRTSGTNSITINTGFIDVKGDITMDNIHSLSTAIGGTATIIISDTADQTINGAPSIGYSRLCNIEINKSAGNLILKDFINIGGDFNYVQGSIDGTTDTSEVVFCNSSGRTISGNPVFHNLTFYTPSTSTNTISDTITVNGLLKTLNSAILTINSGVIEVKGDLTISNSNTSGGGSATIRFSGTGNQTITGSTTISEGPVGHIAIDKASGTLYLKNIFSVQGDWNYIQGTVDATTHNSTLALVRNISNNSPRNISGDHSLNNVTLHAPGVTSYNDITTGDTLTILGTLALSGTSAIRINDGTIRQMGDITITNTNPHVTSTGFLYIRGTSDQTITGAVTELNGKLCNVTIDKPSGTLILKNNVALADNADWLLLNGSLDATTYSSTLLITRGTKTIQGSQTFHRLVFNTSSSSTNNINAGDTLTVNDELRIEGTSGVMINTGSIKAKGNITITNTYTGLGSGASTGTIVICGTGDQTFTGSGITFAGKICSIKIDKPSGTLHLASIITGLVGFEYINGTVNSGTSTFYAYGTFSMDGQGTSSTMNFNNLSFGHNTATLNGNISALGDFLINSGATLNGNSKTITIGGNWDNTGTFTYANTSVTLNGAGRQRIIKAGGTVNFHDLTINKSSQKVLLDAPVTIFNNLQMTKGAVGTTSTNFINIPNNRTCSAGSDSSYISGPMRKTGDDAFTFPLGDTLLSSGAYHPLTITAPSVTSDAFTAQYYSTNQSFGSTLQTDSLSSISNCEHWLLTRTTGTSVVIPTLGWNTNSCNVDLCHKMRAAGWNSGQWNSMGIGSLVSSGTTGLIGAANGISADSVPLVIARTISSSLYPTVTASVSPDDTICAADSTTLTASGGTTYTWSPATGLSATAGASVTASPATTTTYSVVGTNVYGCTDTAVITITVLPLPNIIVSPSDTSVSACSAAGRTLIASGASAYSWAPSPGLSSTTNDTVIAHPTATTTYTVTGTGANGCMQTATSVILVSGSLNISIASTGFTSFTAECSSARFPPVVCNYTASACIDSSLTLTASGCSNPNLTYSWDMGDSTILIGTSVLYTYTTLLSDTIILTVTDTLGNITTLVKYIPITVSSCAPVCCIEPYLYVTDTASGLDTVINLSLDQTIFLCDNGSYNFSSSCYHPDTTNVSWVFSDTDPETADSTYTGNDLTVDIGSGTYTLAMTSYGADCDSITIIISIQTQTCEPVCSDCIGSFAPIPGKKYLLSAWVKEDSVALTKTSYTYPQIVVSCPSVSFTLSAFTPSGRIIDGWQRIEQEFTIPANATDIHIEVKCTTGNCFFDDIRVLPFDGSMKSYVYDPVNMRLTAELDERNYATFYEYDEEGKLVRVKKETEKGIMTIKENRNKTKK
jgi:hypothetical protein